MTKYTNINIRYYRNLGNMKQDKLLEITHNHLNTYIKLADQKASILLSGQIAIIVLVLSQLRNIRTSLSDLTLILISLSILAALVSIAFSIATIAPREESDQSKGFIYWEEIRIYDNSTEFADAVKCLDDSAIIEEMSTDVYNLSEITSKKYGHLNKSIYFSIIFLIIGIVSLMILAV